MIPRRTRRSPRHAPGRAWSRRRAGSRRLPTEARPGRDGGDQHVARPTRVLADHDPPPERLEQVADGASEVVGEGRGQVDIGDAADSVRSEESTHQGAGVAGGTIVTVTEIGDSVTSVTPREGHRRLDQVIARAEPADVERRGQVRRRRVASRSETVPLTVAATCSIRGQAGASRRSPAADRPRARSVRVATVSRNLRPRSSARPPRDRRAARHRAGPACRSPAGWRCSGEADRLGQHLGDRRQHLRSAAQRHHRWFGGDRADLEPGRRRAGQQRPDRHRAAGLDRADVDLDPHRRRVRAPRTRPGALDVDRNEVDLPAAVDPGRVDAHRGQRAVDPVEEALRAAGRDRAATLSCGAPISRPAARRRNRPRRGPAPRRGGRARPRPRVGVKLSTSTPSVSGRTWILSDWTCGAWDMS